MKPSQRQAANLFTAYQKQGDMRARDKLIELYLPLARSVANRYRHSPQPLEDLVQVASLALVKAVDGFDPERGMAFSSYAVPSMVGEIKRYFRDAAWSLHLPRALKERVLLVERSERELAPRLGRAPTVADIVAATGLSQEEVLDALEARTAAHDTESIEADADNDERVSRLGALGGPDAGLLLVEDRATLGSALEELSERDREIVSLRFGHDMTQSEIAERVGISQMQVSRLLRRALAQLRSGIER